MKGIDISKHQDPSKIDYDKLASQIDFAILRFGYTGYGANPPQTNNFNIDPAFETHYSELSKRGVKLGAYYYGGAVTKEEVDKEIEILKVLDGKTFDYPIYYDVEENRNHGTLSKSALTEIVQDYIAKLTKAGYKAGVYANPNWLKNKFDLPDCELWLAHWAEEPELKCGLWQYTSKGKLDGYSGNLDLNKAFIDYAPEKPAEKPIVSTEPEKVTVANHATHWSEKSNRIKIADWVKGKTFDVLKVADIAESNSKKAYLLGNHGVAIGWLLEQDIVSNDTVKKDTTETVYTVKRGDTMWAIARKYNTSVQKIAGDNGITNPGLIKTGQKLVIK